MVSCQLGDKNQTTSDRTTPMDTSRSLDRLNSSQTFVIDPLVQIMKIALHLLTLSN